MKKRRLLPEWEDPKAILMAYPHRETDWCYILDEAQNQFNEILTALIDGGEKIILLSHRGLNGEIKEKLINSGSKVLENTPYNDTWTRDYGPISVYDESGIKELDFGFNGWGLKFAADKDNLVNLHLVEQGDFFIERYENHRDFILEGGSIETDGSGTLLTTSKCLCSPNRNGGKTEKEVSKILTEHLGVERILWLHHGFLEGDDTDSHIDTLARFASKGCIVYVAPPLNKEDIHYLELKKMEEELKSFKTSDGAPYPSPGGRR